VESPTNPIVKNYYVMLNYLFLKILLFNIFEFFITKNIVPNFYGKRNFPREPFVWNNSKIFKNKSK
jgi:hypothetical protein